MIMWLKKFVEVFSDAQEFRVIFEDGFVCEQTTKEAILKNGLLNYTVVKNVEIKDNIVCIYC